MEPGNHTQVLEFMLLVFSKEEELQLLLLGLFLMKVKEESEKVGSTFRKLRSWHLVPSLHGK